MLRKSKFLALATLLFLQSACQSTPEIISSRALFIDSVFYSGALDIFFEIEGIEHSFRINTEDPLFDEAFNALMVSGQDFGAPVAKENVNWYCIRTNGDSILSLKKMLKAESCS